MKKSIILLIILFLLSLITTNLVKATELDFTGQPIAQKIEKPKLRPDKTLNVSPYKDNNEKLYAVMGKTQLIKFDEPVKRISITDPAMADLVLLSPKELLVNGKKVGRTSLIFWGTSEKPACFNLIVQQDTDAVIQAIEQIAPDENLTYNFTDDGLIISGHISSTAMKKNIENTVQAYGVKLVNLTESPTKQVLLEVKIAEASRTFTKTLASQFSVGENAAKISGITNIGNLFDGGNASVAAGTLNYLYSSSSANIAWALNAAETKELVKILAEPKLLALDGQQGSFNVGDEIPYPASVGLSSTTSYAFKNAGVTLNFTPTILEKSNRVILKLSPEVSEIGATYNGLTSFKTRKVDTTVELADGETLIIAGLLSRSTTSTDLKVPGLGDIPGLGFLFSKLDRKKVDKELLIFITPKIVEVDKQNTRMEL